MSAEKRARELPKELDFLRYCIQHAINVDDDPGAELSIGRGMIDALTTMGFLEKSGRGKWSVNVDVCRAAVDVLDAALTPQWEPISTAPRDGSRIMLWDSRDGGFPTFGSWRVGSEEEHGTITHWLPLPTPPEGEA